MKKLIITALVAISLKGYSQSVSYDTIPRILVDTVHREHLGYMIVEKGSTRTGRTYSKIVGYLDGEKLPVYYKVVATKERP